jgi:hypothetical protein
MGDEEVEVMRRVLLFLSTAVMLLTLSGVAQAEPNLILLKNEIGKELVEPDTTLLVEQITLEGSTCVFTMLKGKLRSNNEPSLLIRYPTFEEKECEGGSSKTRFNKTTFSQMSGMVTLTTEAGEAKAKVKVGSCLYGIEELSGMQSVSGLVDTTVSGFGTSKTTGCEERRMFTGKLLLRVETEKEPTFIE